MSKPTESLLLVVAECPVAAGFGGVVALTSVATGAIVFFAPCCGVAWSTLPDSDSLDEIMSLDDIESGSVALVSRDELSALAPEVVVLREEPLSHWLDDIPRLVRPVE